jgi:hypothetical protein
MLVALGACLPHGVRAAAATAPTASASPRPGWLMASQDDGNDDSLRVITHTREHCAELAVHASQLRLAHPGPHREADVLAREGERLCEHGQIRPGIIRLRRAIMLLRTPAPPPSHR